MALTIKLKSICSVEDCLTEPKLILDATAHGSLMALSPKDAVDIINKMSLNDRAAKHNRSGAHRKSGILE